MDDKCIMENILLTEKGVCDSFQNGTIESFHRQCTPGVQYSAEQIPLLHAGRVYKKRWLRKRLVSHRAGWKNRKYRSVKREVFQLFFQLKSVKETAEYLPGGLYRHSEATSWSRKIAVHRQILRQLRTEAP